MESSVLKESFIPKEDFDWDYYVRHNPDLKKNGIVTLDKCYRHWIVYGCYEGRQVRVRSTGNEKQIKLAPCEKFTIPKSPTNNSMELQFRMAIMIHVFDVKRTLHFFVAYLNDLLSRYRYQSFDIYFNIVQENTPYTGNLKQFVSEQLQQIQSPQIQCLYSENRGGDIGGFLILSKHVVNTQIDYRYVIFVHSKNRKQWRIDLCRCLFTYPFEQLDQVMIDNNQTQTQTQTQKGVGLLGAQKWIYIFDPSEQSEELSRFRYHLIDLCRIYHLPMNCSWQFVAGTMFLARIDIIRYIVDHQIDEVYHLLNRVESIDINWLSVTDQLQKDTKGTCNDFQYRLRYGKPLLSDYMIEHTYERIIGLICQNLGYQMIGLPTDPGSSNKVNFSRGNRIF